MADASADTGAKEGFERSSAGRITSADELDHYIKVTNPSAWAVIIAALLLVGGVLVWALIAVVPVTVNTTGFAFLSPNDNKAYVICWVDETTANRIDKTDMRASIDGIEAKHAKLSDTPMSASEVISFLGSDFYVDSIDLKDWNYLVTIEPGSELSTTDYTIGTSMGAAYLVPVSIITSETNPITIVLGKK